MMTFKVGDIIEHVPPCVECCGGKTFYLLACVIETDEDEDKIRWRAIAPRDIEEWQNLWPPCSGWHKVGEVANGEP